MIKTFLALCATSAGLYTCVPEPPAYGGLPCAEWAPAALEAGWTEDDLDQLLPIIYRESRCQPDAIRYSASGQPIDVGLLQINQVHRPMIAERGFTHEQMTDPRANLWFGRLLWRWWEDRGGCGWSPWRGSCI